MADVGPLRAATETIQKLLADAAGWKDVDSKNEAKLQSRTIPNTQLERSQQKNLTVGKATLKFPKTTADNILNLVYDVNVHKTWDAATLSENKVVAEYGDVGEFKHCQLLHQLHKTLSAASLKRDATLIRGQIHQPNGDILVVATSVNAPNIPLNSKEYVRAELFFAGFKIEKSHDEENSFLVTYISCLDLTGQSGAWLHEKFVDQEVTRVAQRLVRIKQRITG
eukprot:TRINITY_DN8947_c0_g1_i1.p1 TRINITY_DN8947_c0_g1~~TRINITY_DN8947_c0_g1_i1.p1  ORF type:complete len:224 (+),score=53.08 TRINITY_DN8947_c0_g1_i1:126-797(+)